MKQFLLFSLIFITHFTSAQDNRVLMTIADEDVLVSEFLGIYNKNNTSNVIDKKSITEYRDLFINFKLKVAEAESLGLDTVSKFVNELAGYRRQLAQPYLVDKDRSERLVREAHERMLLDVAAMHILIRVNENATAADTVAALKRLNELTKSIKTKADMEAAIQRVKADNDDTTVGEDLGYFTAFAMVYPFENAAYTTPVGTLSKPVRTRFGYHAVFVTDKRNAPGEIKVSHLLVKSTPEMDESAKTAAKLRADELYGKIKAGESFEELVKTHSDDKSTAAAGGALPWFGTGRMVPEFEAAAFQLKANGEVAAPVLTNYGWHIIRRDDYRSIGDYETLKPVLKKKIEKDARSLAGRTSLLSKLKADYGITPNTAAVAAANKQVSSEFLQGTWKLTPPVNNLVVLTIGDSKYTNRLVSYKQSDWLDYLQRNQRKIILEEGANEQMALKAQLEKHWDGFQNAKLIEFEDAGLEAKYPEFKALMNEYHDGILLFELMDKIVWTKAVQDSAGLAAYHEKHRNDFMWPTRFDASIYTCANEEVAKTVSKLAKKRVKKGLTDAQILETANAESALNLSIESGLFTATDKPVLATVSNEPGLYRTAGDQGKLLLVQIYKEVAPSPKALSECRGLVTSAYQQELESKWIAELRQKYAVKVDEQVFDSIKN